MPNNQELTSKELDGHKERNLSDKLLPCPFCGGEPEHHVNLCARIVCKKCKARTDGHLEHSNAMAYWNTRAPSKQLTTTQRKLDVAVEALEKIAATKNMKMSELDGQPYNWQIAETALNTIRGK